MYKLYRKNISVMITVDADHLTFNENTGAHTFRKNGRIVRVVRDADTVYNHDGQRVFEDYNTRLKRETFEAYSEYQNSLRDY